MEYVNDNTGTPEFAARYDHGQLDDEPLIMERVTGGTNPDGSPETARYLMHADHLGSIRRVTAAADGATVNRYDYDSFGNRVLDLETVEQPYGFTGREWDAESGLYHYRARAYDLLVGRFVQDDPIGFSGGDLNLSAYVWSDPLRWTDPTGLSQTLTENGALLQPSAGVAASAVIPAMAATIVCTLSYVASTAYSGIQALEAGGTDLEFQQGICKGGFTWISANDNKEGDPEMITGLAVYYALEQCVLVRDVKMPIWPKADDGNRRCDYYCPATKVSGYLEEYDANNWGCAPTRFRHQIIPFPKRW